MPFGATCFSAIFGAEQHAVPLILSTRERSTVVPNVRSQNMKTTVVIRYVSGREEQFETELVGGNSAEDRLKAFSQNPTILLQTENEIVLIPATAIERISLPLPEADEERIPLPNVRKATRIEDVK
jgi:hypothetical protein